MQKDFIPYDQARQLRELGFDEVGYGHYADDINHTLFTNSNRPPGTPAPLYQQAFRWFREKHKLIADPQWRIDNTWDMVIQQLDGYGLLSGQATLSVIKKSTYEEAERACLDRLIQICKNK